MWKNNNGLFCAIALSVVLLVAASCGTKKAAVDGTTSASGLAGTVDKQVADAEEIVSKVLAAQTDAKSMSSKIKFTLKNGQKDLSVSGSLRMKKNEVIRIQLTAFGLMEVGRLEFTKDYVLLMDRMNKEYVKAGYADVGFLRANGLDFYTLQALFWNQLFIPGVQKVDRSDSGSFTVVFNGASSQPRLRLERGGMEYLWSVDKTDGRITAVDMTYSGTTAGKTTVRCAYGAFKPLGAKKFPADITLTLQSSALKKAGGVAVNITVDKPEADDDWETFTSVSSKYKQVSVEDLMKRLLKL